MAPLIYATSVVNLKVNINQWQNVLSNNCITIWLCT